MSEAAAAYDCMSLRIYHGSHISIKNENFVSVERTENRQSLDISAVGRHTINKCISLA